MTSKSTFKKPKVASLDTDEANAEECSPLVWPPFDWRFVSLIGDQAIALTMNQNSPN